MFYNKHIKNTSNLIADIFGWDGVIRTHAYRSQSPRPYHLATSQYERLIYNSTKKYKNLVKIKFFYGIFQKGWNMNREAILNKYSNEEDRLFVAKIIDKINFAKTRNQIVATDFLDMYQKKIAQEVINIVKEQNYKFYYACEEAEKVMLIFYPDKYMDLFENERFNYSQFVKLIRIKLPNELKGTYSHKDYLSGIMKLGIKREKLGDILVFEDGADIVASFEICEYVVNNLQQLTRFSKATIIELNIKEIREPNVKKEEIRIVVASLRLDAIVAELAKCSRNVANEIIENQRVFINYENESRSSKLLSEGDVIVIRGKGKFIVKLINGETRKGKLSVTIEHYI